MDLLTKEKVFGAAKCHMYSVEWQKRDLPHVDILLWLEENIRLNEMHQVISADYRTTKLGLFFIGLF